MDIQQIIKSAQEMEQLTVKLTPIISTFVADAAKTFGLDSSTNAQKLVHVQERLQVIWNFAGEVGETFDKVWPMISLIIAGVVKMNNIGGRWPQAIGVLDAIAAA